MEGIVDAPAQPRQALLEAAHLVKRFGDFTAVNDLTLTVAEGEVFGLLGPNGAGKTTTISMCIGLLRPTSGSVRIAGHDVGRDAQAVKRLIGYVPDEPYLYDRLTGREFVRLMGELYGMPGPLAKPVDRLLSYFDLLDAADSQIAGYSHGMKQKAALCGALIHDPRLLFLDEPTVGLDPKSARLLKDTIRSLADQGRAVLLCTHILEIAQAICDRVAIIDQGRMIAQGSLDELRASTSGGGDSSLEDIFLRLTGGEEERVLARELVAPTRSQAHEQ
jgi:ABC-2 type transport system ATP-binding protein